MYNRFGEEDPCAYFDLIISVNSLKTLAKQLSCDAHPVINEANSLVYALPREIKGSDLDYMLDGMYTLKYPTDFEPLKFKRNGKESYEMVLPTVLDLQHPFTFSASVAFDVHMADISMELV